MVLEMQEGKKRSIRVSAEVSFLRNSSQPHFKKTLITKEITYHATIDHLYIIIS